MEFFQYRAMDHTGRIRQGQLSAPNLDDLESRLQRMGLDLITCRRVTARILPLQVRALPRAELINFCFQLEQLCRAGVPVLQALTDVRDTVDHARFRHILSGVIDHIAEGSTLSSALKAFPWVFDEVFVSLVQIGEQSGQLAEILRELTETLKWQDELGARLAKVFMYPAFVGSVVMGVLAFLMIYLVPQLVNFITSMQGTLPVHTRALLALSDLFVTYWWVMLSVPPAAAAALWSMANRAPEFRLRLDASVLRIWFLGDILRKLILARFSRMFALMYRSGIPVLDILQLSGRLTRNQAVARAIAQARERIAHGESLSRAFESTALFPPLVVRMINMGETTGALDTALVNISYFYDRDVKERVEKLEALIEPTMTIFLGTLLGWIMLAVLGPIYDLISKVQP